MNEWVNELQIKQRDGRIILTDYHSEENTDEI